MKRSLQNYLYRRNHNKEFRRQLRLLIAITLGFTIAFTWRQTIFDLSFSFIGLITKIQSISILSLLSSIMITLISIGLIYLSAKLLKDKPEYDEL